ncbi:unnamed protein product [Pleuronectes platessa]|uniref:Uncharacterized protein n=1 Tax=Pleuronectes platessa TaxID=8262 RepID=A0A9N7YCV6_PLEPL|nr:unnamed protein product [Pleuronectes platessa]
MFIFVVKPMGTCRGWGSSRSVALLSAPPEAQCAAPGGPHPVAPHGAGAEGGPLEGTGLITAEVCDIISNARRFGVATASGVTSQAPARQGLALTPRFRIASASGVNPASEEETVTSSPFA